MKPERITAGIFIFVIGALMLLVFCGIGLRANDLQHDTYQKIDWAKLYPFEEKREDETEKFSVHDYAKSKLEKYTSEKIPGYTNMVEAAKIYEKAIGWNMVSVFDYNAVFRLKDGYLTSYELSLDVAPDAEAVKNFSDFCAEMGIDFMYINFPVKVCVSEDKEISGVLDFSNQNTDRLSAMLKESGVRYYDLRERLHNAGMKHHESFFVTDHHWKPETGLWAAGEILKILHDDFGWDDINPGIARPENFDYVIYRDYFLGSHGKKLTLVLAKPDDLTLIYPKFDTRMKFEVPNLALNAEGSFDILYDMSEITYKTYQYGDHALTRTENELIRNNRRVLVIHGSFAKCVIPFMALAIRNIDSIEPHHFTGSFENFIKAVKPDAVIAAYNSGMPGRGSKPSATKQEKQFYDFR